MKISAASQVLSQLVYVAVLVVLFASGTRATPEGILLLSLGSALILTVGVAPVVWRVGIVPVRIDRRMLRRMLWLSTPVIGLMVSQYVFGSIDIIVLRIYRSTRDVGIYAVAYQAYTVLSAAAVTATAVLVPLFVSLKTAGRDGLIKRYLERGVPQGLFMISVVGGVAVTPLGVMVPVVFGARFAEAATPMAILVVGLAFLFAAFLAAPILTLHERTRSTAVINAIATAINLVADFILIGVCHMGVIAPAIATSGALAFTFVVFYVRAERLVGIESAPDPFVGAPLVAGLVPVLVIHGIAGMVAGLLCVGVATAAVLILRPPFRRDDLEVVSKLELPGIVKKGLLKTIAFVT
jgi:O-antigen/teichoic acid export membrane protein